MQEKMVSYAVLGLFVVSVVALLQTTDFGTSITSVTGNVVDTETELGSSSDSNAAEVKMLEQKYTSLKSQAKELKQKIIDAQKRKDRKAYAELKQKLTNLEKELVATKKLYEAAKQKLTPVDQFTNQCIDGGDNSCVFVFNKDGTKETWQIPFLHNGVFSLTNGYLKVNVLKPAPNSCEIALCQTEDCSDAYTGGKPGVGDLKKQKISVGSSLSVAGGNLLLESTKQCVYGSHTCPYGEVFKWGDKEYSNHVCSLNEPKQDFTNQCIDGGDNGCVFAFNKDGKTETWQIPFLHSGVFSLANSYTKVTVLKSGTNYCSIIVCQKEDCSDAYTGGAPGVGELNKIDLMKNSEKKSLSVAGGVLSLENTKQCAYGSHTCADGTVFKWGDKGYSNHVCPGEAVQEIVSEKEIPVAEQKTASPELVSYLTCIQQKNCSEPGGDIWKVGAEMVVANQLTIKDYMCFADCGLNLDCTAQQLDACFKEIKESGNKLTESAYFSCTEKAIQLCSLSVNLKNDTAIFKGTDGYCKDADGLIDESKYPKPVVMGNYNDFKNWYGYFNPYVNNPVYEFDFKTGSWVKNVESCIDEDTVSERWCTKSSGTSTYEAVNCPDGMMCNLGACIFKNQMTAPAAAKESCTSTYECKLQNPEGYSSIKLSTSNPKDKMTWMGGYNSMEFEFVSATQKSCVVKYKYCEHPTNQPVVCDGWTQAAVKPGEYLPKPVKLTFITESGKVCEQPKTDKQEIGCTSQNIQCTYTVGNEVVTLKTGEKTKSYAYDPANGYSFTMKQDGVVYNKQGCAVVFNHCSPAGCFDIPQGTTFPFDYSGKSYHFGEGSTSLYVKLQKYTC